MDYSLLLGVEIHPRISRRQYSEVSDNFRASYQGRGSNNSYLPEHEELPILVEEGEENPPRFLEALKRHRIESKCKQYFYHFAIIDYLCHYNFDKKGENFLKSITKTSKDAKLISAVPPKKYADRFIKFMHKEVFINEDDDQLPESKKREEFQAMLSNYEDLRHLIKKCCHCGRTYDNYKDPRVGNVDRPLPIEWTFDTESKTNPG